MERPICIYHGGCADGFTAAWAVWRALGDIEFYPAIYGQAPPNVTGRDVIMVDFSYKRPVIDAMAEACRTMLILDHHKTAEAELAHIARPHPLCKGWPAFCDMVLSADYAVFAIFDMNRSGAQLAWDFFHPDKRRSALVDYVADRDLWRFELPGSREISAWLYSWDMAFDTWQSLDATLSGEGIAEADFAGRAILRQHDKNVASLIRATQREMVIGGHTVPVANVPHFMASDAGHSMAEGRPFSATYFDRDGARIFSLRSRDDGADVSVIAAQYGGGGHRNAAGFQTAPGWEGEA